MKNSKIYLRYSGGCKVQNKIWFPNEGFNGLFSIDINDLMVEYKKEIPFLERRVEKAYCGHINCTYNNKIFFFPFNCQFIMVYDIRSNDIQEISINVADGSDIYWTAGIIQYDEIVWILPIKMTQGIFILDLKERQIKRDVELENVLHSVEFIYNYENVIRLRGTEIALLSGRHTIIGIDVRTRHVTFIKRFDDLDIWGLRYDGSHFWLLLYSSTDIYEWQPEEDRLKKYCLLEEEWISGKGGPYSNMIFWNDQVIILPCSLKYIMWIDKETATISKRVEYPEGFQFLDGWTSCPAFIGFHIIDQHNILLHPSKGNMLLIYDIVKNEIKGKELTVGSEKVPYLNEVIEQKFSQESSIVYETDVFGVDLLDLVITQRQLYKRDVEISQIGNEIYNAIVRKR